METQRITKKKRCETLLASLPAVAGRQVYLKFGETRLPAGRFE